MDETSARDASRPRRQSDPTTSEPTRLIDPTRRTDGRTVTNRDDDDDDASARARDATRDDVEVSTHPSTSTPVRGDES